MLSNKKHRYTTIHNGLFNSLGSSFFLIRSHTQSCCKNINRLHKFFVDRAPSMPMVELIADSSLVPCHIQAKMAFEYPALECPGVRW